MKRGHDEAVLDRFLAGEIFNSSEIWENLLILCDDLGSCFAGTPEEAEAARFLEAKLRDYGLDITETPITPMTIRQAVHHRGVTL